jgi:peptidoglycan/xylan/chitin deacetylase (PgdA/CDA1 family)
MRMFCLPMKTGIITNGLILGILVLLYVSLGLNKTVGVFSAAPEKPIYQGNEENPYIAFQCNVVWGTEFVEPMLQVFQQKNVRITFHIGGEWAAQNPGLLQAICEAGHELGNHGYRHKHHSKLSLQENKLEIKETEDLIYAVTGYRTRLFAPPYGDYNDVTVQAARSLGYQTILWSIDTIDWRRDGVDKILGRVFKKPHNGALVLMHPTADTVRALPRMIDGLRALGFELKTVGETIAP